MTSEQVVGARVARNSVWSLVGSAVPSVAVLGASIVMARRLGPEAFGSYVFAVFVYGTAAQVAVWGLPGAVTRYLAIARARGDEAEQRRVVAAGLRGTTVGTAVASACVAAIAATTEGSRSTHLWLAAGVVLTLGPTQLLASIAVGRERFRELALWQIAVGFCNPLLTVAVVLLGGGVTAVLGIDVAATAMAFAALGWAIRPRLSGHGGAPEGFWRYASLYSLLIVVGVVVFQRSEVLLLDRYSNESQIAMYGVAFGLAQLTARITGPLLSALTPALARIAGTDIDAGANNAIAVALDASVALGLAISAIGCALAEPLVELLYGNEFAGAVPGARILFAASWATVVASIPTGVAQARNRLGTLLAINGVGVVVNLTLAAALVGRHGATGAAAANVAAQTLLSVMLVIWLSRSARLRPRHLTSSVGTALAAAAAAWASALAIPNSAAALLVGGTVGGVCFFLVGRLSGSIGDELMAVLNDVVRTAAARATRGGQPASSSVSNNDS